MSLEPSVGCGNCISEAEPISSWKGQEERHHATGLRLSPPDLVLPKGWRGEQKPPGLEDNRLDAQDGPSLQAESFPSAREEQEGRSRGAGAVRAVA